MSSNQLTHENQGRTYPRRVNYVQDGSTAMKHGMWVCYDHEYTISDSIGDAATDAFQRRDKVVKPPTTALFYTNSATFAGVLQDDQLAGTSGKEISVDIYEPGSVCELRVNESVTIGDRLHPILDPDGDYNGYFTKEPLGMEGAGMAIALQTITYSAGTTEYVLAKLLPGNPRSAIIENRTCAAGGGAHTFTLEGLTIFNTQTISANATYTLASGQYVGQRKSFYVVGTQTTSAVVLTLVGIKADEATGFTTVTMETIGDLIVLEWVGDAWKEVHTTTVTLS